jgi:hypothetical protein
MDTKDKLSVLLAEYNALRAEVLAARNVGQGASIFFTVIMANFAFGFSVGKAYLEAPILIGMFAVFCFGSLFAWNENNTISFTRRLRELETEINALAGERLLRWETVHGWGGMWRKRNPRFEGYTSPET